MTAELHLGNGAFAVKGAELNQSKHMNTRLLTLLGSVSLLAAGANANVITFDTPTGSSTSGGPVDAEATFTTSTDTLKIVLSDLLANPTDVAQLISDIRFTLSGNISSSGTSLTSASGAGVNVADNGTTSAGTVPSDAWQLSGFHLTALGGGQPKGLIIGPPGAGGVYTSANGSIAGNDPHNPFYSQTATFVLNIAGVTDATEVTSATFSFGTVPGIDVPGTTTGNQVADGGTTVMLLGGALSGLALARRKLS
jgi:hypothetical protein